jgi:excisionase family DNA binding protein
VTLGAPESSTRAVVDKLWTVEDIATYLEIPVSSVYKMTPPTARVRIPSAKIGGRLRFRKADIDRWLDSLTYNSADGLMTARLRALAATSAPGKRSRRRKLRSADTGSRDATEGRRSTEL